MGDMGTDATSDARTVPGKAWITGLLWLGPTMVFLGLAHHRLWEYWPSGRMGELVLVALAALVVARLLHRVAGWSVASGLALVWCVAIALFSGPLPAASVVLFALLAVGVGGLLDARHPPLLKCLTGMVLVACTVGWLLPLPIHFRLTYLALAIAVIAWRRQSIAMSVQAFRSEWTRAVDAAPRSAAFGVLVMGLAATGTWLPTLQFDDLAYHLRMPWQLQMEGYYPLSPDAQVWALAPWASDVVHSIAQLLAGGEARGPVNALWLTIAAAGVWRLAAALDGPIPARWLSIALFASLPLTASLSASMQTELATAALLAWLMAMVAGPAAGDFRWWCTVAVLAGGLAAMKLTAAAMGAIVLFWALFRHPWPSFGRILVVFGIGLLLAGSSYAYAAIVAGNPFLPLFNGWFESPYFHSVNTIDQRWNTGFSHRLLWDMTFDTGRFLESHQGGGGFLLVAMAGPWLLALLDRRTRAAACIASMVLLLPLLPMQYLRYAYPGMVLLVPVITVAAFHCQPRQAAWLVIATCVLNLAFQANSHWMLRTGMVKLTVRSLGMDDPVFEKYAPERLLMAQLRKQVQAGMGNVLVMDQAQPYFAEAGRRGRTVAWYDPSLEQSARQADADATGAAWETLLHEEGITEVILRPGNTSPPRTRALERAGAYRQAQAGDVEWWHLPRAGEARH